MPQTRCNTAPKRKTTDHQLLLVHTNTHKHTRPRALLSSFSSSLSLSICCSSALCLNCCWLLLLLLLSDYLRFLFFRLPYCSPSRLHCRLHAPLQASSTAIARIQHTHAHTHNTLIQHTTYVRTLTHTDVSHCCCCSAKTSCKCC